MLDITPTYVRESTALLSIFSSCCMVRVFVVCVRKWQQVNNLLLAGAQGALTALFVCELWPSGEPASCLPQDIWCLSERWRGCWTIIDTTMTAEWLRGRAEGFVGT